MSSTLLCWDWDCKPSCDGILVYGTTCATWMGCKYHLTLPVETRKLAKRKEKYQSGAIWGEQQSHHFAASPMQLLYFHLNQSRLNESTRVYASQQDWYPSSLTEFWKIRDKISDNSSCKCLFSTLFQVLYDGLCPICVTEIRLLQFLQRNRPEKVHFIDISLPGYDGTKYKAITYEMAMKEMHVIDKKDKVII